MVLACLEAYKVTRKDEYAIKAATLATWFFGNNPANQIMYDVKTGRVFDGIESENKINYNSGAESTIEALLSIQGIESNKIALQEVEKYINQKQ